MNKKSVIRSWNKWALNRLDKSTEKSCSPRKKMFRFLWRKFKKIDRSLVCPRDKDIILDIGCGTGHDLCFFYNTTGATTVGVDVSMGMLKLTKATIKKKLGHLRNNIQILRSDGEFLRFKEGVFNVVTCFSTIDHIPGVRARLKTLEELYRVAKIGSSIVITVPNSLNFPWLIVNLLERKRKFITYGYEHWFFPWELAYMLKRSRIKYLSLKTANLTPPLFFVNKSLIPLIFTNWVILFSERVEKKLRENGIELFVGSVLCVRATKELSIVR